MNYLGLYADKKNLREQNVLDIVNISLKQQYFSSKNQFKTTR